MKLSSQADVFIPDAHVSPEAFARTTHLGIGAHQDDLEFMAFHGILACYDQTDRWFGGVIMTDGRGSSRLGNYRDWTDAQMAAERIQEQRRAATLGQYGFVAQLGYASQDVRQSQGAATRGDILTILQATRPQVVYLHNLADKHDTHVGCALRCLEALRLLPADQRPEKVYGCEVWRDLDWLVDEEKTPMPISERPELALKLNAIFATQIAGGKRYDLAVLGRRTANATFSNAHSSDRETSMQWAMDLTPLINDDSLDPLNYVTGFVDRLKLDIAARILRSL